jgi:hypothetical protein
MHSIKHIRFSVEICRLECGGWVSISMFDGGGHCPNHQPCLTTWSVKLSKNDNLTNYTKIYSLKEWLIPPQEAHATTD